ncbi:MAG: sensor histidine kinase efflux regulator BaeS [Pigmentiphaga sp.]|nr:sensor histidine kinase efflux regulator BaeS [Pigmentiphaga sp.]
MGARSRLRPGITAKLFLAILLSCLVVALAMGMAVRFSFHAGFNQYLDERDERRATLLADVLTDLYHEQGNWEFLRDEPRLWWRILRTTPAATRGRGDDAFGPPPPFSLSDAAGVPIAGTLPRHGPAPTGESRRYPIRVDGLTVGWLERYAMPRATDALDEGFASQQNQATWVIVALSLLLAALVSLLLARMLLAPIRRIGRATHDLAAGDYTTRVPIDRHDEIGQLAEDFNRLALTLEQNERLRRELVADISHELRTPLAVLRGELEALQDGMRSLTPASLESLQHEVQTLHQLIDDLHELALADVGAMNYRMQRLDLRDLLRQTGQAYHERLRQRELAYHATLPDTPTLVMADEHRLAQLWHNLFENTLRYTDRGGSVQLALHAGPQWLEITLDDSAPGVPAELLPRLFERLFRVEHSRSRVSGGSGLGLAIAQRIVEAHGGRIAAEPSPLGGVRIRVSLPRASD